LRKAEMQAIERAFLRLLTERFNSQCAAKQGVNSPETAPLATWTC
jgi:hypothetical protein